MTHPLFQDIYSLFEVISNLIHKIYVIDVFLTAEAMGKVILWINQIIDRREMEEELLQFKYAVLAKHKNEL